jgi:hypothetical protein
MTSRTLAVLSVVVLALATIVVVDRPPRPPDAGLLARILDNGTTAAATRVTLHAADRADVTLERAAGAPPAAFRLTAPVAAPVDPAAMTDLLGTLEYLSFRREIPAGDAAAADARGLGAAARVITIERPDAPPVELRIGKPEPALGRTWIARPDRRAWYLVDDYFARALDRTADDLRARDLLPIAPDKLAGPLTVDAGGHHLALVGDPPTVEISGAAARAQPDRVAELLRRLGDLRAARFLAAAPAAPGPIAALVRAGGHRLALHDVCPGAPAERLAESDLLGWICLRGDALDWLVAAAADPPAWVERAPLPYGPRDLRALTLSRAGQSLHLVREGGAWFIAPVAPPGAAPAARTPVDDGTMIDYLGELASFQAVAVEPAPAAAAPPAGAAELVAEPESGPPLRFWLEPGPAADRVRVRRPGEPVALVVHVDLARYLEPDPIRFHDRTVLAFESSSVHAISITRADGAEHVVRGDTLDDWSLTTPVAAPADAPTVDALRDTAAHLGARRAVSAAPRPDQQLTPPRRTLVFELDPPPGQTRPSTLTLALGARTPDGCYARPLDPPDAPVYLLAPDDCTALEAPLVTRELFAARDPVAIELPGARYERHGPGWYGPDHARLADADADKLTALVPSLAAPADVLGYGALAPVAARVTITWSDGTTTALLVASPRYALDGRAVIYRLSPDVCAAFPTVCRPSR